MNRYCLDRYVLLFDGCSLGELTIEQMMHNSLDNVDRIERELRRVNSIGLFPHKPNKGGEIVYMTPEEGRRDTRFSRI